MIKSLLSFLKPAGRGVLSSVGAGAKALTSNPRGKLSALEKAAGRAAPWLAGGILGSAYMSDYGAYQKNYMGEEAYNAKYKGAPELAATGSLVLGAYHGLGAALKLQGATGFAKRAFGTVHNMVRPNNKIKSLSLKQIAGVGAMATGTAFTALLPGSGYATAGIAGLAGYAAMGSAFGYQGVTATVAAAVGMGALALNMPHYSAGEGRITDFRQGEDSPSRKMDFNTAGLVQALHHSRRA